MTDAIYHRTLSPAYGPAGTALPDSQPWTHGYWLSHVLSNYIKAPVPLWIKPSQYFEDYATQFEKDFSTVNSTGSGYSMHPIIDNDPAEVQSGAYAAWPDHEVIAHLGWLSGYDVHVPKGSTKTHLSDLLANNVSVWVAKKSPSGYTRYGSSETNFHLGTDIDGRVIWYLETRNAGALQQPFADKRAPSAAKTAGTMLLKEAARQILLRF